MNKADNSKGWFPGWRHSVSRPEADPADMGTAFGLDLCMDSPVEPEEDVPPPPSGWLARLAQARRKSA